MKRFLVASTALATMMTLAAPAQADNSKIKLDVGGYFSGAAAYVDIDGDTGRDYTFGSDSEIWFKGYATLDNGLVYGFKAELELEDDPMADGPDADQIDEVYIFFKGGFGKLEFGQNDGVGDQFSVQSPRALQELSVNDHDLDPLGITDINTVNETSDDSTKMTYISPALAGFKLGISFTPEAEKNDKGFVSRGQNAGDEIVEVGLGFHDSVKDVEFSFAATYVTAERGAGNENEEWNVGASLDFGFLEVGGSYRDSEGDGLPRFGNLNDVYEAWDLGLGYENGPWKVTAQYGQEEGEDYAGVLTKDGQAWMLSGRYNFAKGFRLGGGILYENDEVANMDGTAVVVETAFRF